jgi:hypothetical protein
MVLGSVVEEAHRWRHGRARGRGTGGWRRRPRVEKGGEAGDSERMEVA